ncbi:MAG: flavodoxin-dependent (E)-4-hydroxy-3-methylbut-2-enyl-diphosphate synthase [Clostridia bacterium]|nr:flavodoxin-dependent (E)-4-hydroxy-3-methylbut-2-enyl-diphosphate synthase [Clostridia bacterium]
MIVRRKTKQIKVGKTHIGSDYPITVQSMVNADSRDHEAVLSQIKSFEKIGCDIIRVAVPDTDAAGIFEKAKLNGVTAPLVADIHFDYKLALAAIKRGADKIRINPGNIGAQWKIKEVVEACKYSGIPIRIGVNSGSVEKRLLEKYKGPTPDALAESALNESDVLEKFGFSDIIISIKSSSVVSMIEAVAKVASESDYPLHIGVTEAGDESDGILKNSVGIGSLLSRGIGDTIRVSLTADPMKEVRAGQKILNSLDLYKKGFIEVISCPTCGRTRIDIAKLVEDFKNRTSDIPTNGKKITVAVMGCAVNGPGEAREADFGIAGGDGYGLFFINGKPIEKTAEDKIVEKLIEETKRFAES